jgi:tetratricopeptide (TPR) repeat protein
MRETPKTKPAAPPRAQRGRAAPSAPRGGVIAKPDPGKIDSASHSAEIDQALRRAQLAFNQGRYDDAIAEYKSALELDRGNSQAVSGIEKARAAAFAEAVVLELRSAQASFDRGDYSSAIEKFQSVLKKDPQNARAISGLTRAKNARTAEEKLRSR